MKKQTKLSKLTKHFLSAVATVPAWLSSCMVAYASSEWSKKGTDMVEEATSGLTLIAQGVLSLALVAYGIYTVGTSRMDFQKLIYIVVGGAIIFFGPDIMKAFFDSVK